MFIKKKGKKAIPEDIVRLCKGYLKGQSLRMNLLIRFIFLDLRMGRQKLEDLKNSMKKPTESSWQEY
jgi:hypothetical protein